MRLRRKTCMDEKLRESEERFRQVAENAQEWIWEVDSNGLYTYSSPVVERILGYSPEEIIGKKHFYDFFIPQEREKQKEAAFGIFARKQPFQRFVNKNLHKNGNEVILETGGVPILDSNGKLLGYRGIDLDVTERWKMEDALRESKEKVRNILESSPDAITVSDLNGNIIDCNRATLRMLGHSSKEELMGKNGFVFIAARDQENAMQTMKRVLEQGLARNFEYSTVTKDGHEFPTETSVSIIRDAQGNPRYFVGIIKDITERRKIEGELKETNNRLKMLLETAREGIITADPLDKITFANKAFADMLGYGEEELLNLDLRKLVDEQGAKRIIEETEVRKSGRISRYELVFCRKDGKLRTVQATASPLWNEDGSYAGALGIMTDVTERKNVEKALLESQQKFERLFKSQPDPTVFADMHDRFLDVNPRFVEVFGYSPDEVRGKALDDLLVPEDKKEEAQMLAKKSTEEYVSYETVRRRKDGSTIPVSLSAAPIIVDGQFAGNVITYIDITERKQMEKQLRESEERFRGITERSFDTVATIDPDGKITYVSPSVERIVGYKAEEVIGKPFQDYFTPSDMSEVVRVFTDTLQGKSSKGIILKVVRKDGASASAEVNVSPIIEDGEVVGIQGVARDITERKRMEDALRESEEKHRLLFENVSDVVFSYDSGFTVLSVSPSVEKALGYKPEELVGRKFQELNLLAPESLETAMTNALRVFGGEQTSPSVYEFVKKDGTKGFGEITSSPLVREGKVTGVIAVARDITERRQMQQKLQEYSQQLEVLVEKRTKQLQETQEQLVKSERLAAIGQVAAMVGHDLRNPLTGIKGAAYYLKTKTLVKADKKAMEMLELIEKDIEYSNKIIKDLLEYSREIHLERTETTPRIIIEETLSLLETPNNIQMENLAKNEPEISVDIEKLDRVFVNIIKNAFDAMPNGGKLTVASRKTNGNVEFSFTDTGIGMTEEQMAKVWTPFFTTKAKGMGLGLPICKRMVEAHRGHIAVESTVDTGTTFTITLPIELKTKEEGGEEVCVNAPESLLSTTTKASERS